MTELPGVGAALAEKLKRWLGLKSYPTRPSGEKNAYSLTELLIIEGLGPKRIKILYKKLHIKNLDDLKKELD